jgi:hypothetical protein
MQKNMLLIVNPKAGKGTIKRKLPKIIKNFSDEGYFIVPLPAFGFTINNIFFCMVYSFSLKKCHTKLTFKFFFRS